MLQSLSYGLCMLLILAGLFFLFYIIMNRLLYSAGNDEFYTVVIAEDGDKNLADKIYSAFLQANTLNFCSRKPVYVIDCGISEEEKKLSSSVLSHDRNIVFLRGEYGGSENEYIVIYLDKDS